jgi:hypothetical protein
MEAGPYEAASCSATQEFSDILLKGILKGIMSLGNIVMAC